MLLFYTYCLSRGDVPPKALSITTTNNKILILVRLCAVCGIRKLEKNVYVFCPFSMSAPGIEPRSSGLGGKPLCLYQLSHLTRPPQFKIKIFNTKVFLNISLCEIHLS